MDSIRNFKLSGILDKKKKSKDKALATQELNYHNGNDAVAVIVSPLRSPDRRKISFGRSFSRTTTAAPFNYTSTTTSFSPSFADGAAIPGPSFQDVTLSSTRDTMTLDIQVQPILSTREDTQNPSSSSSSSFSYSARQQQANNNTNNNNNKTASISGTLMKRHANLIAMALIGVSAFIYSLQTLNVKFLGGQFDSWTSTFFRGIVGTVLCLIHGLFGKNADHNMLGYPENRKMLCLRGLLGGLTIASAFFAVTELDLAEASVIIFTAPLWTAVLSRVFGISSWAWIDTFSAVSCLVGMCLVTQPAFLFGGGGGGGGDQGNKKTEAASAGGIFAAILSAITAAGVNITISKLKNEDSSTITLYAMVGSIIVALPGFWYHQLGAHGKHTLWDASGEVIAQLCLTGFLSWMAQMSKTTGLKIAKTMGVLVMRYLDICFCYLWDLWFLNGTLDPRSLWGSFVIVFGCLVSVVMKKGS